MNTASEDQICQFVKSYLCPSIDITADTTIFGDLRTDGQDAAELMKAYADAFHVNLKGFEFERYFGPERSIGLSSLRVIWRQLLGASPEKAAELHPLRVRDLIDAAERGQWPNRSSTDLLP